MPTDGQHWAAEMKKGCMELTSLRDDKCAYKYLKIFVKGAASYVYTGSRWAITLEVTA